MDKYGKPFSFSIPDEHPKTLVLSGGAIKGIYILGALHGIKKITDCQKFDTFIGTSSGAIICMLLSIGYSPFDIFTSLLKNDNLLTINLENLIKYDSEKRGGIFSNDQIFNQVKNQIRLKNFSTSITFEEHFKKTGKKLIVIAFNVTQRKEDTFSVDKTPTMHILKALKLSAGIPIIFKPTNYKNNFYVDGGIWNNFPINTSIEQRNKKDEWILAITTLYSQYNSSIYKCYAANKLNVIMIEDTFNLLNPTLVSNDLEKFTMYVKGQQKGQNIIKILNNQKRRNSY
jgi:predicted acylesterase/phospholipase RssA